MFILTLLFKGGRIDGVAARKVGMGGRKEFKLFIKVQIAYNNHGV